MITHGPDEALKLRAMAARFRALAAETVVDPYYRKFGETAAELEEAAAKAEVSRCGTALPKRKGARLSARAP